MAVSARLHAFASCLPLLIFGTLLTGFFTYLQVPAAAFLGYLCAGIAFGISGSGAKVPAVVFRFGQACLGLLIAQWITPESLQVLLSDWPLIVLGLSCTLLASLCVALGLIHFGATSALTAAWGCAPGAAAAMVASAEAHGVDSRMVATLQYLRILAAIITASLVSHWLAPATPALEPSLPQVVEPNLWAMLSAAVVVLLGVWAGTKIPNGANLIPLLIGIVCNIWQPGLLYVPSFVAVLAFAAIGLHIGLRFDRVTLGHIGRQFPLLLCAVFSLTILCAGAAWVLAIISERDFATLYFALSPGGLDAMAIMALESGSPLPLVLAMQTLRIILVVFFGAQFAQLVLWLARRKTITG